MAHRIPVPLDRGCGAVPKRKVLEVRVARSAYKDNNPIKGQLYVGECRCRVCGRINDNPPIARAEKPVEGFFQSTLGQHLKACRTRVTTYDVSDIVGIEVREPVCEAWRWREGRYALPEITAQRFPVGRLVFKH